MVLHPDTRSAALAAIVAAYSPAAPRHARRGVAIALAAIARELTEPDVPTATNFLLSDGLADPDEGIRDLMVAAGACDHLGDVLDFTC